MRLRFEFSGLWQLTPVVATVTAVALLVVGVLMAVYAEHTFGRQKQREVLVQAQILASTVAPAVVFNDRRTAQEYMNALSVNPEILAAAVYDPAGPAFAVYRRDGASDLPAQATPGEPHFQGNRLIVTWPVVVDGQREGTVYLQAVIEPFAARIARYGAVGLLVGMASLMLAVLASAQRTLRRANDELSRRATALADTNAMLVAQSEQREQAEEALRQGQKMEAVGHLTGGIAHDFNNLLQVVSANLGFMAPAIAHDERARRQHNSAVVAAQRAAQLTRQLLAFARRQPLEPKVINLSRHMGETAELLRRTLGDKISVDWVVGGGLWNTFADVTQLDNAILNLALNSRDAMPEGGKLTLEISNASLDAAYAQQHVGVAPGQFVLITVSDTGSGMAAAQIERAFEPFYTTKPEGRGTGLGLSQVYGFVKQSGGHIKIYSEPGHGTSVKLYLPRSHQEEEKPRRAAPAAARGTGDLVLVVEDDHAVREAAVEMLSQLGYDVLQAQDGSSGLSALRGTPIDLLFTDVVMPGAVSGRELARQAVELQPGIAVLFTSGYSENAIIHHGRLDPGVMLLSKPYTREELAQKVAAALAARPPRSERRRTVRDGDTDPTLAAPPPAGPPPASPPQPMRPRALRVLVVEDEILVRMSTVDMIEELGHTALEAGTSREALSLASGADGVDVLLTDISLPDLDGRELAAELLRRHPAIKVVYASGHARDASNPGPAGALYLGKPYGAEDVRRAFAQLFGDEGR